MSIFVIVLIVGALISVGIKVHRKRQGGSFFWWSGKDRRDT